MNIKLKLLVKGSKVKGLCMKSYPSNLDGYKFGQLKTLRHELTNYDQLRKSGVNYNQLWDQLTSLVNEVYPFLNETVSTVKRHKSI